MSIYEHLKGLKDPRIERGKLHLLEDIIMIVLCGTIAGAEGYSEIATYAFHKREMLKEFLKIPNGIPSSVTLWRVFERLNPELIESTLRQYGQEISSALLQKHISLDGKALKGTIKSVGENLHIVSAWVNEEGISLGQVKVARKSNEITAIPKLLDQIDISKAIITIDAIGCRPEIAEKIIDNQGDYILAIKANNGFFFEQVRDRMDRYLESYLPDDKCTEVDFGHGRLETRVCCVSNQLQFIDGVENWKGLKSLIVVEATRELKGKSSVKRRYYLSSRENPDPQFALKISRGHWGIENSLHWVLDVAFKEDACKVAKGNGANNLATIRKLALQAIREDKEIKGSFKLKIKAASWDDSFMRKLLQKLVSS